MPDILALPHMINMNAWSRRHRPRRSSRLPLCIPATMFHAAAIVSQKTTSRSPSRRCSIAYRKLPSTSAPKPLPATRTTNRSFGPSLKISSIRTRASEEPSAAANGRCRGMPCSPGCKPKSSRSTSIVRWLVALSDVRLSTKLANARFPSSRRDRAAWALAGRAVAIRDLHRFHDASETCSASADIDRPRAWLPAAFAIKSLRSS